MRPMLTVASSLTPHLPWWRNVSLTAEMVPKAVSMVTRAIAKAAREDEPVTGVAVVIRVPGSSRAEDPPAGWSWPFEPPAATPEAEVVHFWRRRGRYCANGIATVGFKHHCARCGLWEDIGDTEEEARAWVARKHAETP